MSRLHWSEKGSTGRLYHAEYPPFSLWLTLGRQQPPEEMWLQVNCGASKPIFHLKIQAPVQDPFIVAENVFFEKYVSPMELLATDLAKPNPRLSWTCSQNLVWPSGTQREAVYLAPYDATREVRVELTGFMTHGDSYVRLYSAHVLNPQEGDNKTFVFPSTTQDFENDEALLEYIENQFFNRCVSPMELLGLDLTAKKNPRYRARLNPSLSWTKTDEVHRHGSDGISRLIVYETQYDQTRWLRLDLSEHTENDTPYFLVDDAYVDTPEGTIWLVREFKADFDTEEEALEHFENYFFTHFTTPMERLSTSLKANPRRRYADVKGRSIPARYLKGLPKELQEKRIRELGKSRDAYKRGDYSELPTDRAARKMGLVKQSAYSVVAEKRGIEWRGSAKDMARRVLKHYGVKASGDALDKMVEGIQRAYNKGLAAWKSGGHRPGATATNWAVARVASLVVGGKAAFTADKKEFSWFPAALQKKIISKQKAVFTELEKQGRHEDVESIKSAKGKTRKNPYDASAVVVKDPQNRILLLRRGPTDPWMPGFWNLPGGRIDNDETPQEAAVRELNEETSLKAKRLTSLGSIASDEGWVVHAFLATPRDWNGRIQLDHENDRFAWVTLQQARALPLIPTLSDILAEV